MARARARRERSNTEISDAILAEWLRVMPSSGSITETQIKSMDMAALSAAFNQILDGVTCKAVLDGDGTTSPIIIVVPRPPRDTLTGLNDYIRKNYGDFRAGMGAAVLFGCGR